ncbi:NusA-like transcription termination signal-binding factor [Candidatus Woesearchaeota archaeon]|nr:NusA-like transcription termination signal-binding factor [Candidatus Woesearchaeota archaeon]
MKIRYDMQIMKIMDCFSSISSAKLKDCFIDATDMLHFIVEENEMGKAIGKKGSHAKMLEKMLNRKIKIVEFNPDVLTFIKNVIFPLKTKEINDEEGNISIDAADMKTRGLLIGRGAQNLRNTESIVKRYFKINEIRIN